MKVCPQCNSSYTDETLIFCLTDGSPLLAEEALAENSGRINWQEAPTVFDPELKIHQFPERSTLRNSSSRTNPKLTGKTGSFSAAGKAENRPYLLPLLGVSIVLLAVGGIFWWLYTTSSNTADSADKRGQISPQSIKRATVPVTAEQENQIKKEAAEFIERWRATNEKKDIEAHLAHYTNTLGIYYDKSGVDKNIVRSDRLRAYQRYDSILLGIDNTKITTESSASATIVFDKSWTMKSPQKVSTGSVQQELHIIRQNNKWLIDGEKDLKVYYINNRENAAESTNPETN